MIDNKIAGASSDAPDSVLPDNAKKKSKKTVKPRKKKAVLPANAGNDITAEDAALDNAVHKKSRRGHRGGKNRKTNAPAEEKKQEAAETQIIAEKMPGIPAIAENIAVNSQKKQAGKKSKTAENSCEKTENKPKKRMFISILPGEQIEVGIDENGRLAEYYLDMLHQTKIKGNIYKGIVHNIDVNLQAAFVDFGTGKNGFLQISEIHPEYWNTPTETADFRKLPPIQKILKYGQELLVQVVKEPAGSKGAFLTTRLSLAGRFLVLTPGQEQIGVSRKVSSPEERMRLKELMNGIEPGAGMGVIVRTVGEGATKTTLKKDLQYLKRLWRDIRKKATEVSAPAIIYQEPGLSERAVRDYLAEDVADIWINNETEAQNVRQMAALLFPRKKNLVHLYTDISETIWEHFGLAKQLEQIYAREVSLPSGGRLVFDQTEALMAIDINSGKISGKTNFESMAFKTNMEAAAEIARQLRLRDIGGQVVIDFIEMRDKKHIHAVEKELAQALKSDRARHEVAKISSFGLLELVRQRMGSSAISISMEICPACNGTGIRRNLEWQALQALQALRHKFHETSGTFVVYDAPQELGLYLLNFKRDALAALENEFEKKLEIRLQI